MLLTLIKTCADKSPWASSQKLQAIPAGFDLLFVDATLLYSVVKGILQ